MNDEQITAKQVIILVMLSTGLVNHVMVIPVLLEVAGRDAWMSVFAAAMLYSIWIYFLYSVMKKMNGQSLYLWMSARFGRGVARCLSFGIAIFLFFAMWVTLKDTLNWTITSYFPQTPLFILALLFVAISYYASANIQSLAISGGVFLFFVIVLGFFVMSANFMYKDYSRLFPLFEHGYSRMARGIVYISGGLVEMGLLVFLQHRISPPIRLKQMGLLGFLLVGLTLGPLIGSITIFGVSEASHQRYPAYEQWRLLQIGKYISHVDFFSIYQWLFGALIRLSLLLYVIADLFPLSHKTKTWGKRIVCALLIGVSLFRVGDATFYALIKHVYFPASLCFFLGLSLLVGWLTRRGMNDET